MVTALDIATDIRTLAAACQQAGVTHVRLRAGTVRELVVLPEAAAPLSPADAAEQDEKRRNATLFGKDYKETDGL